MKKSRFFFVLIALLCLACALMLAACEEEGTVCQHRDADDNSLCDKCGESYTDGTDVTDTTPPAGGGDASAHTHAWGEWVETTSPTCTTKGIKTRICACTQSETEYISALGHESSAQWTGDDTHHWHACIRTGCDEKFDKTTHTPSATWTGDGTHHWKACTQSGCTAQLNKTAHTSAAAWTSNGTHHWHACTQTGCSAELDKDTHYPYYGLTGDDTYHWQTCVCSTVVNKTAHTPSATWTGDGTHHWKACTQSGCHAELDKDAHTHNEENTCTLCLEYKDKGVVFTLSGGTYTVTDYTGTATEMIIPSTYKGIAVTAVSSFAFENAVSLRSVTIPSSVTNLGPKMLYGCNNIETLTLPAPSNFSVLFGGGYPDSLKTLVFTGGTRINNNFFQGATGLTSIILPDSLISIGQYAFQDCTDLVSITIPANVTSIGVGAFIGCSSLTSISVATGNTAYRSVGNCLIKIDSKEMIFGLPNCTIPNDGSVTSIGQYAFCNASDLISITIPSEITDIGAYAFACCINLTSVIFSGNSKLANIGEEAFYMCDQLSSITIPASVTSIGGGAFDHCSKLTSINIPASVTSIGIAAFDGCVNLTNVTFEKTKVWNVFLYEDDEYCEYIPDYDLSNTSTAATYLRSTHRSKLWKRVA